MTNPFAPKAATPEPATAPVQPDAPAPAAPAAPAANPFAPAPQPVAQTAPVAGTTPPDPFGRARTTSASDPFADPAPTSSSGPRCFRDLIDQPVMFRPISIEQVKDDYNVGQTKPRLTADVVVLGTQSIPYGGTPEDPDDPKPHTDTMQAPFILRRRWISQAQPVGKALAVLDDKSAPAWIIGIVRLAPKVEGKKRAVIVEPFAGRDATPDQIAMRDAGYAMAREWFAAHPEDRHDPMG